MTPFGVKIRELRDAHHITLKKMAKDMEVSSAYISALEHGHRGRPGPGFVMQVAGYFGLIWDDAEELKRLAQLSHPRVPIETAGLTANATLLANVLAEKIKDLDEEKLVQILGELNQEPV
ncbi:MAG: helix-turn-helix domain-containing protein [Rhodospirillales bacterium]|nr:helix-turn-helix domain-containing protein [Rhodospirillales bacterium]